MTGEKLKRIIIEHGYSLSEAARRLSMTPQHLNQALSAADVKSGLLEKVSAALAIKISSMYGETAGESSAEQDAAKQAIYELTMENAKLRSRISMLENEKGVAS